MTQWTNVYAGGRQLATYDSGGTHFALTDWLGTKRVELNVTGVSTIAAGEQCQSLPYGDGLSCTGTDVNQLHFTGKQRDTESGNDYFLARYYASGMAARFLTPDWSKNPQGVPYANYADPQSLDLYSYMRDNPLSGVDADGHLELGGAPPCRVERGTTCANQQDATKFKKEDAKHLAGHRKLVLSSKSGKAIDKAAKEYGYDASAFKTAMTQAGNKYSLNPNLLVGLGMRESSLNPSDPNGGLFQIQDPQAYGIDPKDIGNFEFQIPAAAASLSGNISHFNGNLDLGIAAWTLGRSGTTRFFNKGGMSAVRGALLSAKHPDYGTVGSYIDFIKSF